ncbi:MAG: hypothetical protein ACJ74T_11180 [Pyrinomonadaceae bacterium]
MELDDENNPTFKSWLFSKHEFAEKTAGLVVLTIEVISLLQELYAGEDGHEDRVPITYILNLLFLVFIFFYLRDDFARRFSVYADNPLVARLLRLSYVQNKQDRVRVLVFQANTFISQLKNINYFILATAGLYAVFIAQKALHRAGLDMIPLWQLGGSEQVYLDNVQLFHFVIVLLSYVGAFYLLRCFFVMYLPTIDVYGNDILNKQTTKYLFVIIALMSIDAYTMSDARGRFISEFICGVFNSVIFILLIARFENKILDIPPIILCLLYVYAILQTCLPFVTEEIVGETFSPMITKEHPEFLNAFSNIVLTICLVGKVTLSAVLLYVLNTKRIFYYFMTLKLIHDEEKKNWSKFFSLIESFSVEPEKFSLLYEKNPDATYTARIPGLFNGVNGTGATREDAKKALLDEIKGQKAVTDAGGDSIKK